MHNVLGRPIPPPQRTLIGLPKHDDSNSWELTRIEVVPWQISYTTGPELSTHIEGYLSKEVPDLCQSRYCILPSSPLMTFHARPYSRSPMIPSVVEMSSSNGISSWEVGVPIWQTLATWNWIPNIWFENDQRIWFHYRCILSHRFYSCHPVRRKLICACALCRSPADAHIFPIREK